ncbi:XdhC family protein [Streptomyces atratus]|uniref:XdhC family protein n=1 Tax=Streptomyces atratus TaxID=1893 RepID=UPI003F53FC31
MVRGRLLAVATVATVGGSTPRQPGAALAVEAEGTAIGSVSGGCVEGAVYELCQEALETRAPSSSASGYSADDAFAVGRRPRTLADPRLRPAPPALTSRGAGGLGRSGSGGDVSPGPPCQTLVKHEDNRVFCC